MTKVIEKYIQFAIDNGLEITIYGYTLTNIKLIASDKKMFLELITSKPFIKAVARGYEKTFKWDKKEEHYYKGALKNKTRIFLCFEEMVDYITIEQAIAIRENKLEEFINNLLSND